MTDRDRLTTFQWKRVGQRVAHAQVGGTTSANASELIRIKNAQLAILEHCNRLVEMISKSSTAKIIVLSSLRSMYTGRLLTMRAMCETRFHYIGMKKTCGYWRNVWRTEKVAITITFIVVIS